MKTLALFVIAWVLLAISCDVERIADALAPRPEPAAVKLLPADSTVKKWSKRLGGP